MCEVKTEISEDNSGLVVKHHISVKRLSYEIYVNINTSAHARMHWT